MRASILPCSSFAAWYPPFSLRSPSSRAASMRFAISPRPRPLRSSSSAVRRSCASWVSQVTEVSSAIVLSLCFGNLVPWVELNLRKETGHPTGLKNVNRLSLRQPAAVDQATDALLARSHGLGDYTRVACGGGQVHDFPAHRGLALIENLNGAADVVGGVG